MPRIKKNQKVCKACGSHDALYVSLRNGERLPSFAIVIGEGIYCHPCHKAKGREGER
jgi:hypothetical protein